MQLTGASASASSSSSFFLEKFPLLLSLLLAPFSLQQLTKLSDCIFVSPDIFLSFFITKIFWHS